MSIYVCAFCTTQHTMISYHAKCALAIYSTIPQIAHDLIINFFERRFIFKCIYMNDNVNVISHTKHASFFLQLRLCVEDSPWNIAPLSNPSCRQATRDSSLPHPSAHTGSHSPLTHVWSTPSPPQQPPTSWMDPSTERGERREMMEGGGKGWKR